METSLSTKPFWWVKEKNKKVNDDNDNISVLDIHLKQPIIPAPVLKDQELDNFGEAESDIGSIIEEINRLAANSPLGPYEKDTSERSVEDIMKEAEQVFMESSKSFEQLSVRSKTSANLSQSFNELPNSTPSVKSASPLPVDTVVDDSHMDESYSDDFTDAEASPKVLEQFSFEGDLEVPVVTVPFSEVIGDAKRETAVTHEQLLSVQSQGNKPNSTYAEPLDAVVKSSPRITLNTKNINTTDCDTELEKVLEDLKDAKESNNALQLQLNNLNETYQLLKISHEESLETNSKLNSHILECESILAKYKVDLENTREHLNKVLQNESTLTKLLEIEKLQLKSSKLQNEKDARCIFDLNRQVKEMERIIARKHPDSVSALIVAAKNDDVGDNLTTKRFLEERIKTLENEAVLRDQNSSKLFLDVQEKFTEMKSKYESHIEDLELHVNDLKSQLKQKVNSFEVYTQTSFVNQNTPAKDTKNASSQTTYVTQRPTHNPPQKKTEKNEYKEDAHLLATIRGLQSDLANKEKTVVKIQKELDETKKTIRRLQKEREGSLKNLSDKKEVRTNTEKLVSTNQCNCKNVGGVEEELVLLKADRDKIQAQLCRIEEDYQQLKTKRLFDLSSLQQAHENEIATYINNITPLQKQLEIQQNTISLLEEQLNLTKLKALDNYHSTYNQSEKDSFPASNANQMPISRSDQKNVVCAQCTLRQQQLIMYKRELDQLLATVQTLT